MPNEERDALDKVLDSALANYSSEPRAGLEQRVQNRIRTSARVTRIPRWVFAVPAAAAVFWAGYVWLHYGSLPERPLPVAQVRMPPVRAVAPTTARKPSARYHRRRPALPKLPEFPAATPLSSEERALLAFVTRHPEEARAALQQAPSSELEPIRIEPLQIDDLK